MRESSKQAVFDLGSSFEYALSAHRQGSYDEAIQVYKKILNHDKFKNSDFDTNWLSKEKFY